MGNSHFLPFQMQESSFPVLSGNSPHAIVVLRHFKPSCREASDRLLSLQSCNPSRKGVLLSTRVKQASEPAEPY